VFSVGIILNITTNMTMTIGDIMSLTNNKSHLIVMLIQDLQIFERNNF